MRKDGNAQSGKILPAILLGAGSWYALDWSGPILRGPEINPISAVAVLVFGASGFTLLASGFQFLSNYLEWVRARKATGLKGTAGWIESLREIKHELVQKGWGPYWGAFKGEPVISHFEASAFCVGPSGSGKSTKMILTNALALKDFDKTIIDFKSDLAPVLFQTLKKHGDVKIINLGGLFPEIVGESEEYNPLHIVADAYWRTSGLQDISDIVFEMSLQLLPEPKDGKGKHANSYFDSGSRDLVAFAVQMVVLIHGYEATLGHIVQLLNDRESLLQHAQWAAGRLEVMEDVQ
jgi:type IV secretory pathway TraG/TraD family ATPase VirD4